MIVYEATKQQFLKDTDNDDIEDVILAVLLRSPNSRRAGPWCLCSFPDTHSPSETGQDAAVLVLVYAKPSTPP